MIIRKKTNTLALLFAWRGTIFPKVLPAMLLAVERVALAGQRRQSQPWLFNG